MTELYKSIKDEVLSRIKSGQAKMRPRWHFVLQAVLLALGAVILALTLVYLVSFIVFALRQNGVLFAPSFGWLGVLIFLRSLPWLLIAGAAIFMIILEILVRRYSFAYRKPLLYTLVGIIIAVTLSNFAFAKIGLHKRIFLRDKERQLPVAGKLYRHYAMPRLPDVHPGIINKINENGLIITTPGEEIFQVFVDRNTRFPFGFDLQTGDKVIILGRERGGEIRAIGVRRIDGEMPPPMSRQQRGWPRPGIFYSP